MTRARGCAQPGDFAVVRIVSAGVQSLQAAPLARTSIGGFEALRRRLASPTEEQRLPPGAGRPGAHAAARA